MFTAMVGSGKAPLWAGRGRSNEDDRQHPTAQDIMGDAAEQTLAQAGAAVGGHGDQADTGRRARLQNDIAGCPV